MSSSDDGRMSAAGTNGSSSPDPNSQGVVPPPANSPMPGSQPSGCDMLSSWAPAHQQQIYLYQYPCIQVRRPAFSGPNNQRMPVSVPMQLSALQPMHQFSTVAAQPAFVAQPTFVNSAGLYNQQLRPLPVSDSASGTLGQIPRPQKILNRQTAYRTMSPLGCSNRAVGSNIVSNQVIGNTQPSSSYPMLGSQAEHTTMMGPQTASNQGELIAAANNQTMGSQMASSAVSDPTSWVKFVQQISNRQQQAMFNPWNTEISRSSDWGSESNSFNVFTGEPSQTNKRIPDLDSKFPNLNSGGGSASYKDIFTGKPFSYANQPSWLTPAFEAYERRAIELANELVRDEPPRRSFSETPQLSWDQDSAPPGLREEKLRDSSSKIKSSQGKDANPRKLEEMTECSICTEFFRDPRILPCIHTFCLECLVKTGQNKRPGDEMSCPLCRKSFTIPLQGFSAIQKNFFMDELMEMRVPPRSYSPGMQCELCLGEGDGISDVAPPATMYCIECNQKICEGCCGRHRRNRILRDHHLESLEGQASIEDLTKKFAHIFCDQHQAEQVKMFCLECEHAICWICFAEDHQHHKCSDVSNVADGFREKMKSNADKISQLYDECSSRSVLEEVRRHEVLDQIDKCKALIGKRSDSLRSMIEYQSNQLREELESYREKTLGDTAADIEEMNMHLAMLQSYEKYARELAEKGSNVNVCQSAKNLDLRANELEAMHKRFFTRSPRERTAARLCDIEFHPTIDQEGENIIGKISISALCEDTDESQEVAAPDVSINRGKNLPKVDERQDEEEGVAECSSGHCDEDVWESCTTSSEKSEDSSLLPDQTLPNQLLPEECASITTEYRRVIDEGNCVRGLACLDDRIYYLCLDTRKVFVFSDQYPFECFNKEEIEVRKIKSPMDMTSLNETKELFISDWQTRSIWKINIPSKKLSSWPVDGRPFKMSFNASKELLVLVTHNKKKLKHASNAPSQSRHSLDVFNVTSSKRLYRVPLPEVIVDPMHAVQLGNGNFFLIHRLEGLSEIVWNVSEVSVDGKLFSICNPIVDSLALQLPEHVSVDGNGGIFSTDYNNERIVHLDSSFANGETVICSKTGEKNILYPSRVCYLPDKKILIVGQWTRPASFTVVHVP